MSKGLAKFLLGLLFFAKPTRMKFVYLFLFTLFTSNIIAQTVFEEERLNHLLEEKINDYRSSKKLPTLERKEILDAAAFDQADYLKGKNRIEHTQDHKKKETTLDRVLYFGGLYADLEENASKVGIGGREKVYPFGDRVAIETEEQAIYAALYAWLEDENSKLNLQNKYFNHFGSAVIRSDNSLDIVIVFAGLPYQLANSSKEKVPKSSIGDSQKEDCKKLWEDFSTIPQLFSDVLKVEGEEVFFEFHNLPTVEKIISNSGDGIAVDVICDDQFSCGNANRLYPGEVNDGFLLPLAKKGKLTTLNSLKEERKVKLNLGKLPDFYDPNRCELNGIIVKNGTKCSTIPYNKFDILDLRQLEIPYRLIGEKLKESLQWKDSLDLSFSLKGDGNDAAEVFEELKTIAEALNYQIEDLTLLQQFAPTEDTSNTKFLENLLDKVKSNFPTIKNINIEKELSWEAYYAFQQNSIYEMDTKEMDTLAVKKYLKITAVNDTALSNFLSSLNIIKIHLKGTAEIPAEQSLAAKQRILHHLIAVGKVDQALVLQRNLIEEHQDYAAIQENNISQTVDNLPLINNQIVATVLDGKEWFKGNPTYLAFLELFLIAKKYPLLNYNKYLSDIKLWAQDEKKNTGIETWDRNFNKLKENELIPKNAFAKTIVNYALLAANYYYDKGDFSQRKKAFDLLMKYYPMAQLDEKEVLMLAQYFAYQDQFDRAVELLLPKVKVEKPKKDILFYFLQISIYEKEIFTEAEYHELLTKTAAFYPESFCGFFSKEKRGIQPLKDYEVKELYCVSCE